MIRLEQWLSPVIFTDSVSVFDRKTWQWAGKVLFDVILPSYYFSSDAKKVNFRQLFSFVIKKTTTTIVEKKVSCCAKKWHEKSSLVMISIIFILKEHDEKRCCHIFLTAPTFHWILGLDEGSQQKRRNWRENSNVAKWE